MGYRNGRWRGGYKTAYREGAGPYKPAEVLPPDHGSGQLPQVRDRVKDAMKYNKGVRAANALKGLRPDPVSTAMNLWKLQKALNAYVTSNTGVKGRPLYFPLGPPAFNPAAAGWNSAWVSPCGDFGDLIGGGANVVGPYSCAETPGSGTMPFKSDAVINANRGVFGPDPDPFITGLNHWAFYSVSIAGAHPTLAGYSEMHIGSSWRTSTYSNVQPSPYVQPWFSTGPQTQDPTEVITSHGTATKAPTVPATATSYAAGAPTRHFTATAVRSPPGKRVRERKTKLQNGMHAVIGVLNNITEGLDVIEALYDSIGEDCKAPFAEKLKPKRTWHADHVIQNGKNAGKVGAFLFDTPSKAQQAIIKANAVYKCAGKIDIDSAFFNLIWQQMVEDFVYAQLGLRNIPGQPRYGGNLGYNTGDAMSTLGRDTADVLKAAESRARDLFERATGLTTTANQ